MILPNDKIAQILLQGNYVNKEDLVDAFKKSQDFGGSIVDYLRSSGVLTKELLGQAIAESYKLVYADLNMFKPDNKSVIKIPEDIAKTYRIALFKETDTSVTVTTDNPEKASTFNGYKELFPGKEILIHYSLTEDLEEIFNYYDTPLEDQILAIVKKGQKIAPSILKVLISEALKDKASDVHFEPGQENVIIRFRIDGVLQKRATLTKDIYETILNTVKVQAQVRIDDHFSAQDGAIRYEEPDLTIDMRISIVPTITGEKIAMRLLSHYIRGLSLKDIGLNDKDQQSIMEAVKKPFGMILVSGPTGSGKTTTLYSILQILNQISVNITTIEDPVEYKIKGINQIQVNQQTNLTFADGLRSIVRQDPDVILVGETRDETTAEISVNAALTGHLMLSTFHANDAATSIPRLIDMGIEPFLLASTLELIVSQRLVRKLCETCRYSYSISSHDLNSLSPELPNYFPGDTITLFKGKGCASCGHTGYKGRVAVFELIKMTQSLRDLIVKTPTSTDIWNVAKSQGSKSMFEDGVLKVKNGITNIEELMRVTAIK